MKKTKVIIPALGILLLSTAASVTGTVAWFSANSTVYATDMTVKAKVQTGLIISKTSATAGYDTSVSFELGEGETATALYPTSTSDFLTWYTNNSSNPGVATGADYVGDYKTDVAAQDTHYVMYDLWIRSSSNEQIQNVTLDVAKVDIHATQNLSKAIRVGLWFRGASANNKFIYHGDTVTTSYQVGGTGANITTFAGETSNHSGVTVVPSNLESGTRVSVFMWFEGEDANCISNNILASLEDVKADVYFTTTVTATPEP